MSKIDTTNLDETYPVPGINNDSQGFRNNFFNIKQNLNIAKDEIIYLNDHTMKTNSNINLNEYELSNSIFKSCSYSVLLEKKIYNDSIINFNEANYQQIQVGNNLDIALEGWKSGKLCSLMIELSGITNTNYLVAFKGPKYDNNILYNSGWPNRDAGRHLTVTEATTHIVEFWSINGGVTVFSNYIGMY